MQFIHVTLDEPALIEELSATATAIVREYYDPLLGVEQNSYMLNKFQSVNAITEQLEHGYIYYLVKDEDKPVGFMAFYPNGESMYLSKLYLDKSSRGKGIGRQMLELDVAQARQAGLSSVTLNVNKYNSTVKIYETMGFRRIRAEKNDIGSGYYMDDFVYQLDL
ncbi:MAG: GNAT family N-acetyltransferase [Oscillospiraceae bacterium]|nr:GNAT family N-acetyltransferase [Oscillospiraceae bacterium]